LPQKGVKEARRRTVGQKTYPSSFKKLTVPEMDKGKKMEQEKKFDCGTCEYRGMVPGDAHICCKHPEVKKAGIDDNVFTATMQIMEGKAREPIRILNIQGHPQGIRRGWFIWPANFDPTWLVNCDGYKKKE
jgi:hypothetical protein